MSASLRLSVQAASWGTPQVEEFVVKKESASSLPHSFEASERVALIHDTISVSDTSRAMRLTM
jgi:hypothetical protein